MRLFSAISAACEKVGADLFQPFRFGKWFALGFSAWLSSFIAGGAVNFQFRTSLGNRDSDDIQKLIDLGLPFWLWIIAGVFVVFTALRVLLVWLGCRGHFMFIDNVVHGRAETGAPWRKFRAPANDIFRIYLAVILPLAAASLIVMELGLMAFWPVFTGEMRFVLADHIPLLAGALLLLGIYLAAALVMFFIREFGFLWIYRNGGSAWEAVRVLGRLATDHAVDFVLYFLMRVGMAILFIIAAFIAGCLTCCVGFLPYLNAVLLLPLWTFRLRYSMECFAQLGPECDVREMAFDTPPALPPAGS